ncbi:putative outer membrane receptor protein [Candidatus Methylopumilus planktonicus]|uniref:Putative outer membrane receptor protein n=1 Tax=Candidatus Methylopumilus planktonicus TaxID=1581557 RepID=A0A0D6EU79_9PROT|nr:TonB-dependent receptor [Candidatus Methylopumilus planktonicus]CEZ18993.1 putative outer membrane receptor protein [Candidatus Methylopumilus planktonicus]
MKKIILPSLLMTQLLTVNVFADTPLKTTDIFVTATRTPTPIKNVIADVTLISEDEIKRAGAASLQELLQKQPGIEIANLGGAGKVSTIGIRGTSSTHSVILVDGIRLSAATTGFTAIEHIPLSQIEKIEIVRGPASSLYGQDAIGGVIQIFTKKGLNGFKPYVGIGYGSYNTSNFQSGIRGGNDQTRYAINFSTINSDGFSAFVPNSANSSNSINLDKDGYKNYSLSSSLNHKINQDYEIDLQYFSSKGKNQFDNRFASSSPSFHGNYRNEIKLETYAMNLRGQINKSWQSNIKLSQSTDKYLDLQKNNKDTYVDEDGVTDLYKTTQDQFSWQNNFTLPKGSINLIYDLLNQRIKTTDLYEKTQRTNHGFMVGYNLLENNHNFQSTLRKDFNSAYEDAITGNIGYAYALNSNWTVSSSYGTAFVSPSFNYLYSLADSYALGNPNLKPEKSKNIEASARYRDDSSTLSLTIFQNKIDDFIIYSNPDFITGSRTTTQNLNKAEIQGLTISGDQFLGHFQIKGSITTQSAKNEDTDLYLPRRAKTFGNINLNYYIGYWNVGIEEIFSNSRFDDKANTVKLSGYSITNMVADYKFNENLNLNFRLNNVFDKDYSLAAEGASGFRYQTPGRSLFANLRYDF